jgi:arginyl-tRNA synthetase
MKQEIKNWIKNELGVTSDFAVEHPKEMDHGDYAINVALIEGKVQNKNPRELADKYVSILNKNKLPGIEKIEVAGSGFSLASEEQVDGNPSTLSERRQNTRGTPAFINIVLDADFFGSAIKQSLDNKEKFGKNDDLKGKKFFIEHTQPNPFKIFHIGHLMNNAIGESLYRIIGANGSEIKVASYHGDVGLHVAKAIWGEKKLRNPELGKKLSSLIFDLGLAYPLGSEAYDNNDDAKKEIIEINKHVFNEDDEEINDMYRLGRKLSLENFNVLYQKLDSHFDFHFYESESGKIGQEIVSKNIGKIFEVGDNGAVVFRGENFEPKTHTRVFLNSEGLPTYEAKEVGLAKMKKDSFAYDFSLTVTANEQDAFFDVVEVAIGEVFPEVKGKLKHVSHGMLKLPSGKMSSRTGSIISAETLINQTIEKVMEKMSDREMSGEIKKEVAEIVAVGAIKYSILHQAIGGDIIFDFDKSLSFEGDSGPYLQYSYVRSQSVLAKFKKLERRKLESGIPENWKTTKLEKLIVRFPEVVERAGKEYAPHYVATYLTELAGAFNGFYAEHKIVDENDVTSDYRVAITESFSVVMKNGLNLLGIKVPDQM